MLETAKWIACPPLESSHRAPLLRTSFPLDQIPKQALLTVCGLGLGVYTVNGKKVTEDVLLTPISKYDATVYAQVYQVAHLLVPGENVVGAMLGNGWYNDITDTWDMEKAPWRHHVKLIASLELQMDNGEIIKLETGSHWKAAQGPIYYNHTRCGERFDACALPQGWDCPGFDDTQWLQAQVCRGPGGLIKTTQMPPIRIVETLPGKEIFPGVYDFGVNLSGWARIQAKGSKGQKISLIFSEQISSEGELLTAAINNFNKGELAHRDEYFCRGGGQWEEWEPSFCYHGFRYVRVENAPADFKIQARWLHTDLPQIGSFSCSDPMLNAIHQASCRATLSNYHSIPTDCPQREQNGWTGDASLSAEQALMNFDMVSSYEKWMEDFRDAQRPSGQLPGIVPTGGWGFNWGSGPAWDSAMMLIPLYIARYTKENRCLRQMWEPMNRYLGYLRSMAEGDIVDFGLGDWLPPANARICPTALTDTAYYYADAKAMEEGAAILGQDPTPYQELAQRVRTAFRSRFLQGGLPLEESQTALACVLFQGLLEEQEIPAARKRLAQLVEEDGYHISCGILGTKYIFRALADGGYSETLYRAVTNPDCPSYAYWILQGMTTLCEDWDMSQSLNHHMFSEVDLWFYRSLAGIQVDGPKLIIAPTFLPQLDWVQASHRGIQISWDAQQISLTLPQPATLQLPGKTLELEAGSHCIPRPSPLQ